MRKSVRDLMDRLEDAELFSRVGQDELGPLVQRVSGWSQAVLICDKETNDALRMEQLNDIRRQLTQSRLDQWNDVTAIVRPQVLEIAERSVAVSSLNDRDAKTIRDTASWDLLAIALEYEYEQETRTSFYRHLEKWYLGGHLVCGWEEEKRDAVPIIF